ncbi:hypothetical protein ABTZ03_31400 [Kitasatospora sp. NPDC096077]|uniref:hypothetical protein n=1 Tax=Kitasatospora sp. NPDC096077 TaxID=3155544 RepID=UPI00331BE6EF
MSAARNPGFLAVVALAPSLLTGPAAGEAHAFSPENHRSVTAAAVAKGPGEFRQISATYERLIAAVLQPDKDEHDRGPAHCDNADYLSPDNNGGHPYVRTRQEATAELFACVRLADDRFHQAVRAAGDLVSEQGEVRADQTGIDKCRLGQPSQTAKCGVLEGLGRSWHTVEDFYSHSNYADAAKDAPLGIGNPPGLRRQAPAPVFGFASDAGLNNEAEFSQLLEKEKMLDLATGCYPGETESTGRKVKDCGPADKGGRRITHDDDNPPDKYPGIPDGLAKDTQNYTRAKYTFAPGVTNFRRAVDQAVQEIAHQWAMFKSTLADTYGPQRANAMIVAITQDAADRQSRPGP